MSECFQMCPASEIKFRITNNLIHQLEATPSTMNGPRSKYIADENRMVKEYTRSAADTYKNFDSTTIRPYSTLKRTIYYLNDVYEKNKTDDKSFNTAFSFVSDRLRAVRQDMTFQRMSGINAVSLLEDMLPFYIESDAKCKQNKYSCYEPKLHDLQLEECFSRWFSEIQVNTSIKFSESIAECFFFRQLSQKTTVLNDLLIFRKRISEESFNSIKNILISFYDRNFVRFFKLFNNLNYLSKCSLVNSILYMRILAIRIISIGFHSKTAKIDVNMLIYWLGFENYDKARHFLEFFNVKDEIVLVSNIKEESEKHVDCIKYYGSYF